MLMNGRKLLDENPIVLINYKIYNIDLSKKQM